MALIDSIIGAESGGNPNAANPNSSASGPGQFIDSTWLSMIKQHRPDLAQGMSDSDLLALKSDPQLSREMTAAYAADNDAILSKAGLPVTPGTTYLAHFAGPQGAVKVLQADPSASVGDILGASAVNANPFLRGMTARDLQAWADRKMGASTAAPQPASAAAPGPAMSLPAPAAPIFAQAPQTQPTQPQGGGFFAQMPAAQVQPVHIQFAQRKAPDLSRLRADLARAPIFSRGDA